MPRWPVAASMPSGYGTCWPATRWTAVSRSTRWTSSTWPRCDAECSPERGLYYHPSRHSAGQPIVAGWAFQWICQLGFARDSWTAPVDARRLHPLDDTNGTAAGQIHALLARLPPGGPVPLFVFDGG
jgi:hypothetical protein